MQAIEKWGNGGGAIIQREINLGVKFSEVIVQEQFL